MSVVTTRPAKRGAIRTIVKVVLAGVVVVTLLLAANYFDVQQVLRDFLSWISDLGPLAPFVFFALYILACVLLLPGSILTLGAGVVFGVVRGSIVASISSTLGATCAFVIGRYLARGWVARWIAGSEKFEAIDEAVGREGWKIVVLTRLSPMFPFNLLNYAFGLTRVRLGQYFFATWLGMLPGTVVFVYIGSLAGDLATLAAKGRTRTTEEWVLYGAGLVATVMVTVFIIRMARRALAGRISS